MTALLTTGLTVQAEGDISYNYLEVGYGTIDFDGISADGPYFNGAFSLSDQFYLGGYYNRNSVRNIDLDRYGAFLGFHNDISERTDFYTEFNLGKISQNRSSTTYGIDLGTRTAFTENFELISKLGYTEIDDANDGFFTVGLKGLFKFNERSSITLGIENFDFEDFGASIGYRHSF